MGIVADIFLPFAQNTTCSWKCYVKVQSQQSVTLIWQHEKLSARMLFRGKSPIRFDPVNHKSPLMSKRSVKCDCCPKSPPGCPKGSQWAEDKRDISCSLNHSCTIWAQWTLALSESKYACACLIQYIHIVNWAQFFGLITPMNQDPTSWRSPRSQHHPLHCSGLFGRHQAWQLSIASSALLWQWCSHHFNLYQTTWSSHITPDANLYAQ